MEQGDGREGLWGMKGGGRVERVCVPADSGQRPQLQKPHGRIGFRPCPAGPTHRVLDSRFFQSVQRECSVSVQRYLQRWRDSHLDNLDLIPFVLFQILFRHISNVSKAR